MIQTPIAAAARRRTGLALALALLTLGSGARVAAAEVATVPAAPIAEAPLQPQALGSMDEIDLISRKQALKTQKLRCWQEGKLIVEREVDPASAEVYRSVELADAQQQPMRLYDLRNATCLIQ